jgi:hypothetical protein
MEVTAEKLKSKAKYPGIPTVRYYRSLLDEEFGPFGCKWIRKHLEDILENRLPLNRGAKAGKGDYDHYFIPSGVDDDELPWDVNDTTMDW